MKKINNQIIQKKKHYLKVINLINKVKRKLKLSIKKIDKQNLKKLIHFLKKDFKLEKFFHINAIIIY